MPQTCKAHGVIGQLPLCKCFLYLRYTALVTMPPCSAKQPTYVSSYKITDRSKSRKSQFKGALHHYKEGDQTVSKVRKQI